MENMNQAPYLLQKARFGYRLGHDQLLDAVVQDGLWCPFEDQHMGNAAEWIAQTCSISRGAQDRFALASHQKAVAAIEAGRFKEEIVPVEIPQRRGAPILFDTDECPRKDVTSQAKADELGLRPMARITGYTYGAVPPLEIFTAPVFAIRDLLQKTGTRLGDYDLIEINEAFASQCLGDAALLDDEEWDWSKVNVNGGAIALGHPIGCSGTRVLVTLLYALKQRDLNTGLATLCLGGGEAVAMSIERL
jgi:acetyl-CoA C-acetyltransferase